MNSSGHNRLCASVVILLACGWALSAQAQREVTPEVFLSGRAALSERIPLHYTGITEADSLNHAVRDTLDRVLTRDLTLSGLFNLRLPNLPPDTARSKSLPTITYLDGHLIAGDTCRIQVNLRSVYGADPFWDKAYEFPPERGRAAAHRIASEVIRQVTGEPSVMQTRIAFSGRVAGVKELYSTTFDGFDLRPLTTQGSDALSPDYSPDGILIAYTSFLAGQADIYILDLETKVSRMFQNSPGVDSAPAWSPDGERIAYSSSEDGNAEIYVRSVDGGEARRLTYSWAIETSPSWSPTGREIAFTSDRLGRPQVFIMEADGTNQRRLSTIGSYNDSPAWSPRGDLIAYVSRGDDGFQIYLTDPQGDKHVKLTSGPGDNMDPCWSPDGLRLAFSSTRTGQRQIYTMDLYGRGLERITDTRLSCSSPTWSPVLEDAGDVIITSQK